MLCAKIKPLLDHIKKVNIDDDLYKTSNHTYLRSRLNGFFQMVHFYMNKQVETNRISSTDYQTYMIMTKPSFDNITNIKNNSDIQFFMDRVSEISSLCKAPMIDYLCRCFDILMNINCVIRPDDYKEIVKFRMV